MPPVRYADTHRPQREFFVQTVGSQAGPPLGDGWTMVAPLRAKNVPSGAAGYVIVVSGTIGDIQFAGTGAERGMVQLCVGTTGGAKFAHLSINHWVRDPLGPQEGVPFLFVVSANSRLADDVLGSSVNLELTELCLWARTYTNQQAQTWFATFSVCDVHWLWWHVDDIPSADWHVEQNRWPGGVIAGASPPADFTYRAAPTFADGETWLHFYHYRYRTKQHQASVAPTFEALVMPDGTWGSRFVVAGAAGRWGLERTPPLSGGPVEPLLNLGSFYTWVSESASTRIGFVFHQPTAVGARSILDEWRWFAVRIDPLPDVVRRWVQQGLPGGVREQDPWRDTSITVERPALSPPQLTEPIVIASQSVAWSSGIGAYATRIRENSNFVRPEGPLKAFPKADATRRELVPSLTYTRRVWQRTAPATQFLVHAVGSPTSPPGVQQIVDFHFVHFNPVRDPENQTTGPGAPPAAVVLSPGRQGPAPGSVPAPPTPPNTDATERGIDELPEIRGSTGYRRRWPIGSQPVRQFSISWGPLSDTAARAVFDFLVAHAVWRYTPPRGAAATVLNAGRPQLRPTTHRSAVVTVEVVELVWVGA